MLNYLSLTILEYVSTKLKDVTYEEVYSFLENNFEYIPAPIAKVSKGAKIDRVRPNNNKPLFKNINELSYISDQDVIKNRLTYFGRANAPHQPMFYGCLTSVIEYNRLTAISETCNYIYDESYKNIKGENFTLSRWNVKEDFLVVEIVFSDEAMKNNRYVIQSFEKQSNFLAQQYPHLDRKFNLDFLTFISNQFAKKVNNDYEYMISVAYTNLVMQLNPEVCGFTYPSVKTEYKGANIVLSPKTVDVYLEPEITSTLTLYKKDKHVIITNGEHYSKSFDLDGKINWLLTQEKDLTPLSIIQNSLLRS